MSLTPILTILTPFSPQYILVFATFSSSVYYFVDLSMFATRLLYFLPVLTMRRAIFSEINCFLFFCLKFLDGIFHSACFLFYFKNFELLSNEVIFQTKFLAVCSSPIVFLCNCSSDPFEFLSSKTRYQKGSGQWVLNSLRALQLTCLQVCDSQKLFGRLLLTLWRMVFSGWPRPPTSAPPT